MTHGELVQRAVRWLLGTGGCSIAFSELNGAGREIPDAIGFANRWSKVIECKTSRADFLRDRGKPWRRLPELGMGAQRYFMVPSGIVSVFDLPPKWGLLEVRERHVRKLRESEGFTARAYSYEVAFLVSMLRRAEIRALDVYGNAERPFDFLNQWLKWGSKVKVGTRILEAARL